MNYRDEEDIFEEDVVFDQSGLLSSARKRSKSAIRRVSSGRCAMLSKTMALCGAFFGLGLAVALPGPATPVPPTDLTDNEAIDQEHIYRCLGFMLGCMLGGMLLDRFNRLFLVFLALLVCAILVAMVPWTGITWLLRSDLIFLGATMGFLLTGGNVLCLDLWAQNSGPFMQALHFSFSLGAFLAPLIARPLIPAIATVAPVTVHPRFPREVNFSDIGFAEGIVIPSLQPQNLTGTSEVPLPFIVLNKDPAHMLPKSGMATESEHMALSTKMPLIQNGLSTPTSKMTSYIFTSSLGSTVSPNRTSFQTSGSTASPPTATSNLNPSTLASSTNAPIPTISTGSPITMSSTSSPITGNTSSTSSTTLNQHSGHHKPKPPVNMGDNLDKPQHWDNVRVGKPPPEDLVPITSTKATTSATASTTQTTAHSTLSVKKDSNLEKTQNTEIVVEGKSAPEDPVRIPSTKAPTSTMVSTTQTTNVSMSAKVATSTTESTKNATTTESPSLPLDNISQKPLNLSEGGEKTVISDVVSHELKLSDDVHETNLSVSSSVAPKPTQPSTTTSTTTILTSTQHSDVTKISSSVSPSTTTAPTQSSTHHKSYSWTADPTPKLLRLGPPTTSVTVTTTQTQSPRNDVHVASTTAPRRHHSKPSSYDNDTEEIHTVMDEVADRAKKYGVSRLQLSYLLVALLLLVVSLLFLGFLCFNPRDPRSRSEEDVGGGRSNVVRPRWIRIMLTTLTMLVLALSAGIQFSYGHLLAPFAMHSSLSLPYSTASALTATFWGAVTSTRLACILLASALSPGALLLISVVLTSAATWLVVALATQSAAALWVGAVLVAVGTASILPSSFLWMQHHVHVSHHVAGMLVMGPAMGEMLFPQLAERIMVGVGPEMLYFSALLSLAVIALWAAAWRLARHPCAALCNRNDPAEHSYQLASQTDEDDLLDLTMSPLTNHSQVARRTSQANGANGNGLHRHRHST